MEKITKMLSVREATKVILSQTEITKTENVRIQEANGRMLAQDLIAKRTQPPFDSSAMDGYAINHRDFLGEGGEVTLKVVGEVPAGKQFGGRVKSGECVRIFTGAPLPNGTNTVVPQEEVRRTKKNVRFKVGGITKNQYVRKKGCDFKKNQKLIRKNQVMNPAALTLAAAMNYNLIPVRKKPKVCIIASGDELVSPGQKTKGSQIVASNAVGVQALTNNAGAESVNLGIAKDNVTHIQKKIQQAIKMKPDIIITIGGASVGEHDLIKKTLNKIGASIKFHKIKMKPGKPLMCGKIKNTKIIGLPGNPVSSLVCTIIFVIPLIKKMIGQKYEVKTISAVVDGNIKKNSQRQEYQRAVTYTKKQKRFVRPIKNQDSSLMNIYHKANCLIIRKPNEKSLSHGNHCTIIKI